MGVPSPLTEKKAQNLSFQLEKINSLEMLYLGARSWTVAKLMTQAQLYNNENKSPKIKEVDRWYVASGDLGPLTLDSNKQDGKRQAPGRV